MKYVPEPFLGQIEDVPEYLQRQLWLITEAFDGIEFIELPELHVAPDKPRNGMIILADGTDFNPGSGAGFYGYSGGAWTFLG
jgi:hypothetical protein